MNKGRQKDLKKSNLHCYPYFKKVLKFFLDWSRITSLCVELCTHNSDSCNLFATTLNPNHFFSMLKQSLASSTYFFKLRKLIDNQMLQLDRNNVQTEAKRIVNLYFTLLPFFKIVLNQFSHGKWLMRLCIEFCSKSSDSFYLFTYPCNPTYFFSF